MTELSIPRPTEGDVVDLILADHRLFEDLLHQARDVEEDRAARRAELSAVLVAHAEAEELKVYPTLRRRDAIDAEQEEHSEHEHDEGHEALLELLQVEDTSSGDFGEALEDLTRALAHHLDEEERTVLNPARTEVSDDVRFRLGENFAAERTRQLDAGCGHIDNVRSLVRRAHDRSDDE